MMHDRVGGGGGLVLLVVTAAAVVVIVMAVKLMVEARAVFAHVGCGY